AVPGGRGGIGVAAGLEELEVEVADALGDLFRRAALAAYEERTAAAGVVVDRPGDVAEARDHHRRRRGEGILGRVVAAGQRREGHLRGRDVGRADDEGLAGIAEQQQVVRAEDL